MPRWYSQVLLPDASTAIIRLRTRKNARCVTEILRKCVCASQGKMLCAVCYLRVQVAWHKKLRRGPAERLFQIDLKAALSFLRSATLSCEGAKPTWHSFRRGYATDLLASGRDWGAVMLAGGWASNSFLDYLRSRELSAQAAGALEFSFSDSDAE